MDSKLMVATYPIFQKNIELLLELRPKLGGIEANNFEGNGHRYLGDQQKIEEEVLNENFHLWGMQTTAINTSIYFNAFSYYEGFLEYILFTRIRSMYKLENCNFIIKNYIDDIIKNSNLEKFYKNFQLLFGITYSETCVKSQTFYESLPNYFKLRHLLVHPSMIEVMNDGKFPPKVLTDLIKIIKKDFNNIENVNLGMFLQMSEVVDNFVSKLNSLCIEIEESLIEKKLLPENLNPHLLIKIRS